MNLKSEVILTLSLVFCYSGFSQELNAAKCMTQPNTSKKVDNAIKECSEEVKTNIIKEAFKIIHHQMGHSHHVDDEHHVHIYHDSSSDPQNADIYPEHQPHHEEQHVAHVYHDENDLNDEHQPYHDTPQHHNNSPGGHSSNDFSTQYHHQPTSSSQQEPIGHNYIIHEQHSTPAPEHYVAYEQRDARHNVPEQHYPISQSQNPTSRDSYRQHPIHRHIEHMKQTSPHGKHHQYEMFDTVSRKRKRHAVDDHWQFNTVSVGDKRIAGCLLHCIYSKNKAVDNIGWPTLDGLVHFYSEGVQEHGYFMATLRAVNICLKEVSTNHHINRHKAPEQGQSCDVSFELFDCISDKIAEYCSDPK